MMIGRRPNHHEEANRQMDNVRGPRSESERNALGLEVLRSAEHAQPSLDHDADAVAKRLGLLH
jgi:hypothetical protein